MVIGMKMVSFVVLGSLATILCVSGMPSRSAGGGLGDHKISKLIGPAMYPMLRKMSKDAEKKIACVEAKKILPEEKVGELKEIALKLAKDVPSLNDKELGELIKSYDHDPRVKELLPIALKNAMALMTCTN